MNFNQSNKTVKNLFTNMAEMRHNVFINAMQLPTSLSRHFETVFADSGIAKILSPESA